MEITIPIRITLDPAQFAGLRSPVIDAETGARSCDLDLFGGPFAGVSIAEASGVSLSADLRIRGSVAFTRSEAAAALGVTEADIEALTAEQVERDAPFTAVVLGKILAALQQVPA
jgi:hypothetical protein